MADEQGSGDWVVRPGNEDDLAEIVQLERGIPTAPHWAEADYAALLRSDGAVRRCLFVAVRGELLAGFAVGSLVAGEAELESVAVREELRQQGLGRALCRAVLEWSWVEGAAAVALEVRAGSAGAIRLYESLGFVAVGRRPAYYRDPSEDALLMRCLPAWKFREPTYNQRLW